MQQPIQGILSQEGWNTFLTVSDHVHPEQSVRVGICKHTLLSRVFYRCVDVPVRDQDNKVQVVHIPVPVAKEALRQRGFSPVEALEEIQASFEVMLRSISTARIGAQAPIEPLAMSIGMRKEKKLRKEEPDERRVRSDFPPEIWSLILAQVGDDKEAVKNIRLVTRLHHDIVWRVMRPDLVRLMVQNDPKSYTKLVQYHNPVVADPEVVQSLLQSDPELWKLVPPDIQQRKEIIDAALQIQPSVFFLLPEEMQHDPILKRMAYISSCAHSAPSRQRLEREEKDPVLIGFFHRYARDFEQAQREVMMYAPRRDANSFRYKRPQDWTGADWQMWQHLKFQERCDRIYFLIDPELERDREALVASVRLNAISNLSDDVVEEITDKAFAVELLQKRMVGLGSLHDMLRQDRDVVLQAVQINGMNLQYASLELQADREIALAAVQQNPCALSLVPLPLRLDEVFLPYVLKEVID